MPKYGLIGYPLSHSFSKKYFNDKFEREGLEDHYYELYPLQSIEELPVLLDQEPELAGFNVTIPYKEQVIDYLDAIEDGAAEIGAVNCVRLMDGKKVGYNTDIFGFQSSLENFIETNYEGDNSLQALVLGTGGAAKAVEYCLTQLGIAYKLVSRIPKSGQLGYQDLDSQIMSAYRLIINTTPLGMAPKIKACPNIPYDSLGSKHLLYDLIYNPEKTLFLQQGESAGAAIMNGLEMLIGQAEKNWEIWTQ